MFDIKEDVDVEPQCITALMEQLDVFISIKPKPKQPSKVLHGNFPRGFLRLGGDQQSRERLRVSSRQNGILAGFTEFLQNSITIARFVRFSPRFLHR